MATGIHIATGLNGQRSIWPAAAISFNPKTGEYKDFKGRVVKPVGDRMGVALDGANGGQPAKRKPVGKDSDKVADALVRKLLPALKRMVAETAEGEDGKEEEQEALFGGTAEDSTEQYAEGMSGYAEAKAYWAGVNANNLRNRGRAYASVAARANKGH